MVKIDLLAKRAILAEWAYFRQRKPFFVTFAECDDQNKFHFGLLWTLLADRRLFQPKYRHSVSFISFGFLLVAIGFLTKLLISKTTLSVSAKTLSVDLLFRNYDLELHTFQGRHVIVLQLVKLKQSARSVVVPFLPFFYTHGVKEFEI